jgi:hypothetical protein
LRAINPDAGRDEKDVAARAAQAKRVLGEMFKGEQIPEDAVMPGLGDSLGSAEGGADGRSNRAGWRAAAGGARRSPTTSRQR